MAEVELPRWKCHKEVRAAKIVAIANFHSLTRLALETPAGDGSECVDSDFIDRHRPEVGGYLVVYADGYTSYSPAKAFESGYTRLSTHWRDRVIEERRELDARIDKLRKFLETPVGLPTTDAICLLRMQLSYMTLYSSVLSERLGQP